MRGKRVERRFGWDTHGLPIEMLVEKKLGLSDPHRFRSTVWQTSMKHAGQMCLLILKSGNKSSHVWVVGSILRMITRLWIQLYGICVVGV